METLKYKIALYSNGSIHIIGNIEELWNLYQYLLQFDKNNVIYRLFSKSVNISDIENTLEILEKASLARNGNYYNLLKKVIGAYKYLQELNKLSLARNESYDPFRFIILDEPYCTISDNIPLEDYDNNDGEPFWMRPGYILEHYSKSNKK